MKSSYLLTFLCLTLVNSLPFPKGTIIQPKLNLSQPSMNKSPPSTTDPKVDESTGTEASIGPPQPPPSPTDLKDKDHDGKTGIQTASEDKLPRARLLYYIDDSEVLPPLGFNKVKQKVYAFILDIANWEEVLGFQTPEQVVDKVEGKLKGNPKVKMVTLKDTWRHGTYNKEDDEDAEDDENPGKKYDTWMQWESFREPGDTATILTDVKNAIFDISAITVAPIRKQMVTQTH